MTRSGTFTIGVDLGQKDHRSWEWTHAGKPSLRISFLEQLIERLPEQDSQVKVIAQDMLQEIREVETQSLSYPMHLMNEIETFLRDNGVELVQPKPLFPVHHVNARHSVTYM